MTESRTPKEGARVRYTRETLLSFRDLPLSQNLPDAVDKDLLTGLLEDPGFFGSAGIPGLPGVLKGPVRSRLIDGQDSMIMMMPDNHPKSSPKHIHGGGRRQMADRWDATKSPERGGSWKGHRSQGGNGVVSPDSHQKNVGQRSRWVKMEEEESWRKNGDDESKRETRYAWGGSNHEDKAMPEWADVNPNQEIQMTADVIEAERQEMQNAWRKELQEKKARNPDLFEEISEDEIEKWKKEQEEQDKTIRAGAAPHDRMPVNTNDVGPAQGHQVDLQNLFGAAKGVVPPSHPVMQDISAQLSQVHISTGDVPPQVMHPNQGKNLLAMLHAGARPPSHGNTMPSPGMPLPPGMSQTGMPPPPGMSPMMPGNQPYRGVARPPPGMFPPNIMPPPPHMSVGMPMPQNPNPPHMPLGATPQNFGPPPTMIRPGQQINVAALFGRPAMPQQQQSQSQSLAEIVRTGPPTSQTSSSS